MMTEMETTDAPQSTSRFFTAKRFLFLLGSAACGFLVVVAATQLYDGSRPGLRRTLQTANSNSLQSWLSFNKQTGSLGLTPIDVVEEVGSNRPKVMELRDPSVHTELSSNDEEVIVTIVEHKDPDLSESGKDEFHLKFEGGKGEFDQRDVAAALSEALKSGLRDDEEISKAVSENLSHHHKNKNVKHTIDQLQSQQDKP